ncbi:hypothetical protein SAMN04489725_1254 [Alicyclobacillus hesperidum]|uniref:Uncharacterized protein n=1 Tax=Alicyclobacillus hesperidum TaxID=89784 RepID=A0A1H2XW30_9BACL|nr:hypothetical protein SAMN04489725_1254 [Alicyclobacillus hesperidum]
MNKLHHHKVICSYCGDEISSRGDLVTLLSFPQIVDAVHTRCYGELSMKRTGPRLPLNSIGMIWIIVLSDLACFILFVSKQFDFVFILVGCIAPLARIISWLMIERKLKP